VKWKDYEIDQNGDPISEVTNRDSGETLKVKARFAIGADGTDSAVRKKLANVKWEGLPGHSADRVFFTSIHAKGDLRTKMTEMNRKGQLYFMLHPRVKGGIIIYDLSSSWVFARETDPVEEPISTFTEDKCRQLIDPCVGPGIKYDIASANSWFIDPRICSSYSDATFRVFVAGDSAHSFAPSGGLGSNTGIGDVHNLCWKLRSVIDGKVVNPKCFLSTYSSERIHVARANALQSFVNASRWWPFMKPAVELMSHISPDDDAAIEAEFESPRDKAVLQERIEL
jgi:2-polyprenyl-6-methoxyphenol hydroxylase-like FAD-dependent oxidoreductase